MIKILKKILKKFTFNRLYLKIIYSIERREFLKNDLKWSKSKGVENRYYILYPCSLIDKVNAIQNCCIDLSLIVNNTNFKDSHFNLTLTVRAYDTDGDKEFDKNMGSVRIRPQDGIEQIYGELLDIFVLFFEKYPDSLIINFGLHVQIF